MLSRVCQFIYKIINICIKHPINVQNNYLRRDFEHPRAAGDRHQPRSATLKLRPCSAVTFFGLCQKWYVRTPLRIYDRTTLRIYARTVCGMAFLAWARFLLKPRWHQICREIPVNTSTRSQKSKVRSQIWSIACLCSYSGSQSVILCRNQSKCFIQPKMILCTHNLSANRAK